MWATGNLKFYILITAVLALHDQCQARLRFTNMICNYTDYAYGHMSRCALKAVSRNVQYITLSLTVFQLPITDMTIRVQLMTRLNGWRPFLYDETIRCNFSRTGNHLTRYVFNMARKVSNIQTDCPYNQVFDLPQLNNTFVEAALKQLPVPKGKYGVFVTIQTYNKTRGTLSFQAAIE